MSKIKISLASGKDRKIISRIRYHIYSLELKQHHKNQKRMLRDDLDYHNIYIIASYRKRIIGFVSITPPESPRFSIDKYLSRKELSIDFDSHLYEVRLLTVLSSHRGTKLTSLLMYAAFRWVEAHGGRHIIAIGRRQFLEMYLKVGFKSMGRTIQSGEVSYELVIASVEDIRQQLQAKSLLNKLERSIDWQLKILFHKPAECFHGGSFFKAIGEDFQNLNQRKNVINADVLDAWFPPSPRIQETFLEHSPWLLQTSPPVSCQGVVKTIAETRGILSEAILPGAGSSDLIFLALRHWLNKNSRVLITDPSYGEYFHVLEKVIGCQVEKMTLSRQNGYLIDLNELKKKMKNGFNLIILVNPNNPTGHHLRREDLEELLSQIPPSTLVWIDETYIEYVGTEQSLERFAVERANNIIISKSLSKVYALSGLRAAYLCASPHLIEELRALTPPWVMSLPAQIATVYALQDRKYYADCYKKTVCLREELYKHLKQSGFKDIILGKANFLLFHLPKEINSEEFHKKCRLKNLFLRDTSIGTSLTSQTVRIAVKDSETNRYMIKIMNEVCFSSNKEPASIQSKKNKGLDEPLLRRFQKIR